MFDGGNARDPESAPKSDEARGAEEAKPNAEPPVSVARMRDMTLGHDNCPEEERESPHGSLV